MDSKAGTSVHMSSYQPGGYGSYNPGGGYAGYPPPIPPAGGELAGLGGRILAILIDGFLSGIVAGVLITIGAVVFGLLAAAGSATQSEGGSDTLGGLMVIGGFLFYLVVLVLVVGVRLFNEVYYAGKHNGQTIGKKMMGIRVVKEDGTPFGYMDAFLRNIVGYFISSLVCDLGFIWGLFDSRKQCWHDKIFKTLVVKA